MKRHNKERLGAFLIAFADASPCTLAQLSEASGEGYNYTRRTVAFLKRKGMAHRPDWELHGQARTPVFAFGPGDDVFYEAKTAAERRAKYRANLLTREPKQQPAANDACPAFAFALNALMGNAA